MAFLSILSRSNFSYHICSNLRKNLGFLRQNINGTTGSTPPVVCMRRNFRATALLHGNRAPFRSCIYMENFMSKERKEFRTLLKKKIDDMFEILEKGMDDPDGKLRERLRILDRGDDAKEQLPIRKDWSKEGFVSPIKTQQNDDCWGNGVVDAVESLIMILTGKMVILSVQELLDWDVNNYGFQKWRWGSVENAYYYIRMLGIAYEADYPYTGKPNHSFELIDQLMKARRVWIDGYDFVKLTEEELQKRVAIQPVTVVIANCDDRIMEYTGENIFDGRLSRSTKWNDTFNHTAVVVGWDVNEKGRKYWKIKFAWGPEWGDNGYLYLGFRSRRWRKLVAWRKKEGLEMMRSFRDGYQITYAVFPKIVV